MFYGYSLNQSYSPKCRGYIHIGETNKNSTHGAKINKYNIFLKPAYKI